jgi:DNA-binding response OmpR family regulator
LKQRILLVEDDRSISEMVEAYLTLEGFHIVHAADGEEALRLFSQETYDLVLLDVMLPKLSGIDFLKKIREHSLLPMATWTKH